jgi:4-diphosphocytidyl-2-C-methyl-D-erythritol kinase
MVVTARSFAKINIGLSIGSLRPDGYHDLRTIYQTIGLHDLVRVEVTQGSGIEIRCAEPGVPRDRSNTCYKMVERAMAALKARGRVVIDIDKRLPVRGGLGGASGNAIAAVMALERALQKRLSDEEQLRLAAEVGSDLPLFLLGGTVLGTGRGEEVYPLPDFASVSCVIATLPIEVSTPMAFAEWDSFVARRGRSELTQAQLSDKLLKFGRSLAASLGQRTDRKYKSSKVLSGVSAPSGRGRGESPLLDLVRTGIENDFEQVVFPKYPELGEVKRALERAGAFHASLSGSGSAIYGLFENPVLAAKAGRRLMNRGIPAAVSRTLTRHQYRKASTPRDSL